MAKKLFLFLSLVILSTQSVFAQDTMNMTLLIESANSGDVDSQKKLVYKYYEMKSYHESKHWCDILIANPKADNSIKGEICDVLGVFACNGYGMEQSYDEALKYWSNGADYESYKCAVRIATFYDKTWEYNDYGKAWYWYVKAADLGDKKIRKFVAEQYENPQATIISYNDNGTVKFRKKEYPIKEANLEKALYYYELYFSTGISRITNGVWTHSVEPQSKYKVAKWYLSVDSGIQQNYDKAVSLFHDIIQVQTNRERYFLYDGEEWLSEDQLGELYWYMSVCYRFGRGVTKNALKALNYTKKAAELGNSEAINLLNQKK